MKANNTYPLMLVAVDVRSAFNIGSLFRTCDGFSAGLTIVGASPRPRHDDDARLPYVVAHAEREIAKTALGAEKTVAWQYFEDIQSCIAELRAKGYMICAIEQNDTSQVLKKLESIAPLALIVGREVSGLTSDELKLCDALYEIPMSGSKESFNVTIAAGIALYEARR